MGFNPFKIYLQDFKGDGFTCEDVNECNAKKAPCSKAAECVNTMGGFECQCPEGFEGNGMINGDGEIYNSLTVFIKNKSIFIL